MSRNESLGLSHQFEPRIEDQDVIPIKRGRPLIIFWLIFERRNRTLQASSYCYHAPHTSSQGTT